MRGRNCPEAWACRLLAKLPVPERVGSKVLPIPTKTRLFLRGRLEAVGEQQEPPRIYGGEVSDFLFCQPLAEYEGRGPSACEGGKPHVLPRESDAECSTHARLDYHATVRDLPSHERPRERLQHFGPQALSLAELLAIILRTGTRGDNALDLANKLLAKYGGLPGLVRADFRELCAEHGIGEAKSAQVKAALEIGRRLASAQVDTRYKISTPADAANLVMLDMAYLDSEQMRILLLDAKGQLIEKASLYQGTANSAVLRAAEVFRPAVIRNCPGLILCHNHPSGDPTPSREDIETTKQLVAAGRVLDIELVDHIIIGHQRFVSLKEHLRWK
jgi:DNA repair protein RadC